MDADQRERNGMADALNTGAVQGLEWYELPRPLGETLSAGARGDRTADVLTIVCPPGGMPIEAMRNAYAGRIGEMHPNFLASPGFRPFDEEQALPGRLVLYDRYAFETHESATAEWIRERLRPPGNVDVEYDGTGPSLMLSCRAVKKGCVVRHARKVPEREVLEIAAAPILRHIMRAATDVPLKGMGVKCRPHVNAVLAHLNAEGRILVARWLAQIAGGDGFGVRADSLPIPPILLPGLPGIHTVRLDPPKKTDAILMHLALDGGHEMTDDDVAVNATIAMPLPDTVLAALRDRPLAEMLEGPWSTGLRIKSVKTAGADTVLRCFADCVPITLPQAAPDDLQASEAAIARMTTGEAPRWKEVDASALEILRTLTRPSLAAVLALLELHQSVSLGPYGAPGWRVKSWGGCVIVDDCPKVAIGDLTGMAG